MPKSQQWNQHRTDEPIGISAEVTTITGGSGKPIHAFVARPTTPGPHPGIVAFHHMPGWDEFYQEFAERFARHGYITIVPNLYEELGHGLPEDIAGKVREAGGVPDDSVVSDGDAALKWLQSQSDYNGKAGAIGTCSGGRHALLAASRLDGFSAVADLWGGGVMGGITDARPVPVVEYTDELDIPILGLFGNDDQNPPPDQVDAHEEVLKKAGKDYEFHRYDGAGHGFFYYQNGNYRQEQAMDGWSKIFTFFGKTLAS